MEHRRTREDQATGPDTVRHVGEDLLPSMFNAARACQRHIARISAESIGQHLAPLLIQSSRRRQRSNKAKVDGRATFPMELAAYSSIPAGVAP